MSDRSGEYCEIGLRVGDLLRLTTQQILELKGKQNKISGLRKAKQKKSALCISRIAFRRSVAMPKTSRVPLFIPVQKGRPNSGLQAVKLGCRVCWRGVCQKSYLTKDIWLLVLQSHEGYYHAATYPASFLSFCHPTLHGYYRRKNKQCTKNI